MKVAAIDVFTKYLHVGTLFLAGYCISKIGGGDEEAKGVARDMHQLPS
jgi:hypothetical protein